MIVKLDNRHYNLGGGREGGERVVEGGGRVVERGERREEGVWKGGGEEKGTYHVSYRRKA